MSLSVENDAQRAGPSSALYLNYSFFKIDPKWRWLNDIGKEEAAKELSTLIEVANTKMKVRAYSTLGLRHDMDFMLWMVSDSVEKFQTLASKLYSTVVGKYIESTLVYLSAYRRSIYSNNSIKPRFMLDSQPMRYLVVYPFIKSREWYLLPSDDRKIMMEEHITVGKKFPQVQINTSYSFGIHDQDFTLAFETDDLMAFQDLIVQLRETKVSRYVVKDTPMIVCVHKLIDIIIRSLG
jgi:chlorite dismutase